MNGIVKKYKETRDALFEQSNIAPESKFVSTSGPVNKVHYLELGKGSPLILIHGGLSHSCEWFSILNALSNRFHLYVVDRPGHGLTDPIDYTGIDYRQSAVEFLASFMESIGLRQAYIMGNSMGGFFGICFALAYPGRVKKLLLIGAPAGLNRWIPPMLRLLGIKGINKLLMNTVAKPSISGLKIIHEQILVADMNKLPQIYFENGYYHMLLPGVAKSQRTMLENVLSFSGWKEKIYLGEQLHKLTIPVHFIWGEKDAFESPETGISKAKNIKNHSFEKVSDAGHCPWLDQPEKCAALIINMLNN